jgi:AraC-like DNA-binding protein
MRPGDVFCIPANIIHQTIPSQPVPYTVSVVLFSPALIQQNNLGEPFRYLEMFEQRQAPRVYKHSLPPDKKRALEQSLLGIHQEITGFMHGYRYAVVNLLQQMLIDLNRSVEKPVSARSSVGVKSESWMEEILAYIDLHLTKDLTLSHLARQALVSPSHFSRIFTQMTGLHLPAYLNMKRALLAKNLLEQTDLPIDIISERCCFKSASHFYKTFKKHIGCTPGSYRHLKVDGGSS